MSHQGSPASCGRHLDGAVRAGEGRESRATGRHGVGGAAATQTAVATHRATDGRCTAWLPSSRRRSWFATRPVPPRVSRLQVAPSGTAALTINGDDRDLAITPDGSRVVYVGNQRHAALRPRARRARASGGVHGRAAWTVRLARWPVDRVHGQPRGIEEGGHDRWTGGHAQRRSMLHRGATWGPDDNIIFANGNPRNGLQRVSAAGGTVTDADDAPTGRAAKPIMSGRSSCRTVTRCFSR